MLKISQGVNDDQGVTLCLEGALSGPWVEELRSACDSVLAGGDRLTLDLAGLTFLDAKGVGLLVSLRESGNVLGNASAFVLEMLKRGDA